MDTKNITIFPELIEDVIAYILVGVLLCVASKLIHDWKEKRRIAKEVAEYRQMKEDEHER